MLAVLQVQGWGRSNAFTNALEHKVFTCLVVTGFSVLDQAWGKYFVSTTIKSNIVDAGFKVSSVEMFAEGQISGSSWITQNLKGIKHAILQLLVRVCLLEVIYS